MSACVCEDLCPCVCVCVCERMYVCEDLCSCVCVCVCVCTADFGCEYCPGGDLYEQINKVC